jgi:hypothetical protein
MQSCQNCIFIKHCYWNRKNHQRNHQWQATCSTTNKIYVSFTSTVLHAHLSIVTLVSEMCIAMHTISRINQHRVEVSIYIYMIAYVYKTFFFKKKCQHIFFSLGHHKKGIFVLLVDICLVLAKLKSHHCPN